MGRALTVLCCLWGTSASRAAEPSAPPTRDLLAQGEELLAHGELDLARDAFEQAYERERSPRTALALARVYELSGLGPEALRLYAWLADGPDTPETQAGLEGVKRLRPEVASGRLALTVSPDGAAVVVDGEPRGSTPIDLLELPPGAHTLVVTREGFRPAVQRFEIQAGRVTGVFLALDRLPAEPSFDPRAPWPWVMLGTGAALLVAGTATYAAGDASGERRDGPRKVGGAVLWAGSGAALLAAAAIFIAIEQEPAVRVLPAVGAGRLSVVLEGRF
jgi:hypothetical protein